MIVVNSMIAMAVEKKKIMRINTINRNKKTNDISIHKKWVHRCVRVVNLLTLKKSNNNIQISKDFHTCSGIQWYHLSGVYFS